ERCSPYRYRNDPARRGRHGRRSNRSSDVGDFGPHFWHRRFYVSHDNFDCALAAELGIQGCESRRSGRNDVSYRLIENCVMRTTLTGRPPCSLLFLCPPLPVSVKGQLGRFKGWSARKSTPTNTYHPRLFLRICAPNAHDLRLSALAFAIHLFWRCAHYSKNVLDHRECHFTFTRKHFIGACVAHDG